jgi:hypothetical protein
MIDDTWLCLKGLLLKVSNHDFRFPHVFFSDKFMGNFTSHLRVN